MTDLVTISIAVSRAEAVVVASMLEGYGIPVHIGADRQGSTEYWSHALGGYRLWISEDDHETASELIRQSGALEDIPRRKWPRRPLIRFLLGWMGLKTAVLLASSLGTGLTPPLHIFAAITLETLTVSVNPQGKADYFLTEPA